MVNVAVFVSGSGTNCENVIRHFEDSDFARVVLTLSNRPDAYALERAARLGVPTAVLPKAEFNKEEVLLPLMKEHSVDFIVLAGFLLVIPDFLINEYAGRVINVHPALLPKFGGKGMYGRHVHEAVKAAGEMETGMTVHWVSSEVDGGKIIAQFSTPLEPDDTPEDIAAKEHALEMKHFPKVIEEVLRELF